VFNLSIRRVLTTGGRRQTDGCEASSGRARPLHCSSARSESAAAAAAAAGVNGSLSRQQAGQIESSKHASRRLPCRRPRPVGLLHATSVSRSLGGGGVWNTSLSSPPTVLTAAAAAAVVVADWRCTI